MGKTRWTPRVKPLFSARVRRHMPSHFRFRGRSHFTFVITNARMSIDDTTTPRVFLLIIVFYCLHVTDAAVHDYDRCPLSRHGLHTHQEWAAQTFTCALDVPHRCPSMDMELAVFDATSGMLFARTMCPATPYYTDNRRPRPAFTSDYETSPALMAARTHRMTAVDDREKPAYRTYCVRPGYDALTAVVVQFDNNASMTTFTPAVFCKARYVGSTSVNVIAPDMSVEATTSPDNAPTTTSSPTTMTTDDAATASSTVPLFVTN